MRQRREHQAFCKGVAGQLTGPDVTFVPLRGGTNERSASTRAIRGSRLATSMAATSPGCWVSRPLG